jgi:hypothetical protein
MKLITHLHLVPRYESTPHTFSFNLLNTGQLRSTGFVLEDKQRIKERNDMIEDGHTFRTNGEQIPKKIMSMELKGKRQRGRPRSG